MPELRKMNVGEFARRLRADSDLPDKRFAFFIGAGCSISSGIPGAGSLVKDHWFPKLQEVCAPDPEDFIDWLKKKLPEHDSKNPAASYGSVIEHLFLQPEDRQREIERLCDGKFPGFGYAVLATLIAKYSGKFNVVITTNFDDLVSDALYLFTRARPLVIGHESLAGYIRPTRTRPLVIKIHGDARLSPQNTVAETANIQREVERQVNVLLHDRAIIFMGYGGNDKGIEEMLSHLPNEALPFGIYWVSGSEPQGVLRPWLERRNAIWVEKFDFDETMLLIRDAFDLPHPNMKQVESVFQLYASTYEKLSGRIRSAPSDGTDESLKKAVDRADSDLEGWAAVAVEANRFEKTDPDKAERILEEGIEMHSDSAPLITTYANFLSLVRKNNEKAELFYKRAIEADPDYSIALGAYAVLLDRIGKDNEKTELFYQRAIEADPNHEVNLGNYAAFLDSTRKDSNKAEQYYQRAIDADPNNVINLANYADYLNNTRKDSDKAEQFYQRAFEVDPNDVNNLNNYAAFLHSTRKDSEKAEQLYQRAIELDPNDADLLVNYADFLYRTRKDSENAEQFYQRAFEANSNDATILLSYAIFLDMTHKDSDKAEQFYQRAFELDPSDADILANYATFLSNTRGDAEKAEQFYQRAIEADSNDANILGNYAGFLLSIGNTEKGYSSLEKVIALLPTLEHHELATEIWFYAFSHWPENKRDEALKRLKAILISGERSFDWDLSKNVKKARKDGHPDIKWIEILADVITNDADIKQLDDWKKWKDI